MTARPNDDGKGAQIIEHPRARSVRLRPRALRTRWLTLMNEILQVDAVRGIVIYEQADGNIGYASTADVTPALIRGLLDDARDLIMSPNEDGSS